MDIGDERGRRSHYDQHWDGRTNDDYKGDEKSLETDQSDQRYLQWASKREILEAGIAKEQRQQHRNRR